ncbi:MAG TPA: BlaI/MecI/CopY family transcriptional regulator [Pyrinomonadaceae bacterium]|nr:BlaI/MecI/CopY family transcriptional regulator [Pyrinomonadaceae bacterium]
MVNKNNEQLTPLELEIMDVLWETGSSNVQTVQQLLKRELAYTTVQTMLNILHRKKKVERTLQDRAYFYQPIVSRGQIVKNTVNDLIERLFGGSAENLVMNLLETKKLTPQKLAKLNKLIKESQEKNDGND